MALNRTKHKTYIKNKDIYKRPAKARKRASSLGLRAYILMAEEKQRDSCREALTEYTREH